MCHRRKTINLTILIIALIFAFFEKKASAQNLNPAFPRIGQVFFFEAGAAGADIWKNHDLLAVRFYKSWLAKKIKAANPNVILLGANAEIVGEEMKRILGRDLPEGWFARWDNGEKIKIWGGYLMNLTEDCPKVNFVYGEQKFYEFLAQYLKQNTDWNYFNGLYFDGWIAGIQWMTSNYGKLDFNNDGVADGESKVLSLWSRGNELLIGKVRELTGKIILAHEAAGTYYFNGNAFEFWTQETAGSRGYNVASARLLSQNSVAPRLNYANGYAGSFVELAKKPWLGTLTGSVFRADFTSAQIEGVFFGHDEGSFAHRFTFLHDEFEANLGYPTSSSQSLASGLWVRYFENGAIISNISGEPKTVYSNQLTGGPYWRFRGSQDPVCNNGAPFDSDHPINFEGMDGILLFKQPITLVTPIIIDNVLYNLTTAGQRAAEYKGTWTQSRLGSDGYGLSISWGSQSELYAYSAAGNGDNTATYKPKIEVAGEYEVFEWHGGIESGYKAASDAPYKIYYKNGTVPGTIDQTRNSGKWNSLGTFNFEKGNSGYVQISNKANGYVISDAIKFELKNADNYTPPPADKLPPNEPRSLQLLERTKTSLSLSWSAPLPASDNDIASYYQIYRDGTPLTTTVSLTFVNSGLESGITYNYEIYSYDDAGNRSTQAATGSFATLSDIDSTPPEISSLNVLSLNTIEVVFSEPVVEAQATDITNYSINNNIQITNAFIFNSTKVHLKTSAHQAGDIYVLTINNIEDQSAQKNKIALNSQKSYSAVDRFLVYISADNNYELYVNGNKLGEGNDSWWEAENYLVLNPQEKNVVAIKGIDVGGEAGLIVEIEYGGTSYISDDQWKVSTSLESNWQSKDFSDEGWLRAVSFGAYASAAAKPWSDTPNGGIINGISINKGIQWIWSANNIDDNTIYLRRTISKDMTPPSAPQGVTVKLP